MAKERLLPPVSYPYEYRPARRQAAKRYTRAQTIRALGAEASELLALAALFALVAGAIELAGFWPLFILGFLVLMAALRLPVRFATGYLLDKRYGLVTQSAGGWLRDYGKEALVGIAVLAPLLAVTYALIAATALWWALAALLSVAVNLFMNVIFPVVIFPFLYRTEPYTDRRQRDRLLEMARAAGAKRIGRVLLAQESEKSVRANAFFAGVGKTKSIVLYDTLVTRFHPKETESVVAHELGHYVNKDTWRFLVLEALIAFPVFFLVDWALGAAAGAGWIAGKADATGLPLFLLAFGLLEFLFAPLHNAYSRHREARADWFALEHARDSVAAASTEKRLADQNLTAERMHPLLVALFATHPLPEERVRMAEAWGRAQAGAAGQEAEKNRNLLRLKLLKNQ